MVPATTRKQSCGRTALLEPPGGIDQDGILAKTAKGVVSLVSKLFSPLTQKEGVRTVQKAFRMREIFQTTGIGLLYIVVLDAFIATNTAQAQIILTSPTVHEYATRSGRVVRCTLPMNGKITPSPKVKEIKRYRRHHFLNGYAYMGLRPDTDITPTDYSHDADYKWTEYLEISYGVVAENRDHDPDAEPGGTNSEKYKLFDEAGYHHHGDEF